MKHLINLRNTKSLLPFFRRLSVNCANFNSCSKVIYNTDEPIELSILKQPPNSLYNDHFANFKAFYFGEKTVTSFDGMISILKKICPHVSKHELCAELTRLQYTEPTTELRVAVPSFLVKDSVIVIEIVREYIDKQDKGIGPIFKDNKNEKGDQVYGLRIRPHNARILDSTGRGPNTDLNGYRHTTFFRPGHILFDKEAINYSLKYWSDRLINWRDCGEHVVVISLMNPKKLVQRVRDGPAVYPSYVNNGFVSGYGGDACEILTDNNRMYFTWNPLFGMELVDTYYFQRYYCLWCGNALGRDRCYACNAYFKDDHFNVRFLEGFKMPEKLWKYALFSNSL